MTAAAQGTSDLDPSELATASVTVARQQGRLADGFVLLADRLAASSGMAGGDTPAEAFAGVYAAAADSAFTGFGALIRILDGVTTALVTTGNNHIRAERYSDAATSAAPDLLPRPPTTEPIARTPAPAVGPGIDVPWDLVRNYWPTADPARLHDAASSWRAAATSLANTTAGLRGAVVTLVSGNSGPDVEAMSQFWDGLIGTNNTLFSELELLCEQLALLCERYGRLVEETHTAVRQAVGIMLATGIVAAVSGIGLAVLAHVALAEVEVLLNPTADEFATRLPTEVLSVVDAGVVARAVQLAAGTATPQAVEAELSELEDATDAGLGGTEVPPPVPTVPTQSLPRFTADRFADPTRSVRHTNDHAAEFGLTSEKAYVDAAAQFLRTAQERGIPALVDRRGTVRVYDAATNTIASYDSTNGIIKTFFRPTSPTYWARRSAGWGTPVRWE